MQVIVKGCNKELQIKLEKELNLFSYDFDIYHIGTRINNNYVIINKYIDKFNNKDCIVLEIVDKFDPMCEKIIMMLAEFEKCNDKIWFAESEVIPGKKCNISGKDYYMKSNVDMWQRKNLLKVNHSTFITTSVTCMI